MEFPASVASLSANTVGSNDVLRRSIAYHPNIWGDFFLAHTSEFMEISIAEKEEHERLKEEIKKLLVQTEYDSILKLELIDSIQRLGVGYHFEKEIDRILRYVHQTYPIYDTENKDLRMLALRFRLLRQQGFHVPFDVLSEFIDAEGNLTESIAYDIQGILSLYEASNYGVLGEEILDKALDSCSSRLESLITDTDDDRLSRQVKEALKIPISKTLTRLGARKFISMYKEDDSHNEKLLKFAMLDFNMVQRLHQNELSHLTRWWKELDFANKLPFARDRLVECYFWIMGVYYEPRHEIARKILTKVIYMASVLDDIYDVYGTLDELTLFTSFVRRWDISGIDELPTYMRIYLRALFDVYVEMEEEMGKIGKSYAIEYAKEEMKRLAEVYFQEAQWFFSKYKPTMQEYMKVALLSSGYMMMTINSLAVIKDPITKKEFDWVVSEPPILKSSSIITRLMDDLAGYGSEEKHSAVHLYMNEKGVSEEEAFQELRKQVKNSWKNINKECLKLRPASVPILTTVVNFTRVIIVLYTDEDAYGNSKTKTKDMIKSILVDPV
uniref:(E)-beta-caryophyllene synthase n=1 Tax=Origanum vulgare TaxID=39352 RepID=BCPSD_ORIVU|nr:RecName: Full=(E)-beta-caryophyllene synthase; AltName: Full=Alpha-humulene synthase; AltName: Full=Terpene synthase 6; Short=OvTPS6 [Origanum vulgare]ADK73616.1 terpene synthase 6 [Origanum vulgare]